MIGLGSTASKSPTVNKTIVRDGLVLRHDYTNRLVEPVSSGSASFNGTSDYIDMGDVCNLGTGDFSISLWVNLGAEATNQYLISKYVDASNHWYLRTQNADKIQFFSRTSADESVIDRGSITVLSHNVWHHVVITAERGTATKSFINGVLEGSGDSDATDLSNAASLHFGRYSSNYASGYMSNVGIWSAALTQPQIKSIMHKDYAGLSASEKTGLVSWWNLDSTLGSYTGFSETDGSPSTMSNLVLDSANQGLTAVTVSNSNFTSGSGTSITNWTNESDQWTKVGNTVVSGTTKKLLYQDVLTANTAHKAVIRARRTSGSAGVAELSCYFGGNNFAFVTLTDDFVDYEFHGLQDNNTILYLHNKNGDVTVDSVEVYIHDGNTGNLI